MSTATLLPAAQAPTADISKPAQCVITPEEKAVLAVYFRTLLDVRRTLTMLASTTQAADLDVDFINLQLAANGNATSAEARRDFSSKNKSVCEIGTPSGLPNVRVIPAQEERAFHARYGKRAELVRVSRVGFNHDRTVALLHVSVYGATYGGGYLYVFQRKAGRWVKTIERATWTT